MKIIHGCFMVKHYLTFLFDLMYCNSNVPTALKRGTILTLNKGARKPNKRPKRASIAQLPLGKH